MKDVTVRPAVESDAKTIVAFNCAMALETENKILSHEIISRGVASLLNDPAKGFYLVAENRELVIGCLMITREWSDWRNASFWWIQSVYVKPEFRRKGVYRNLYQSVKSMACLQKDVCGYRLYVERENLTAQKTYERLGMKESCYKLYEEELKSPLE